MNRAKLEFLREASEHRPDHMPIQRTTIRLLLDALLEGGDPAPDVGPNTTMWWTRLEALEAYRTEHDAYDLEVHGSLKALEGRVDAWERSLLRLEAMRTREQGAAKRGLVLELLDALLGPPDVESRAFGSLDHAPDVGQSNAHGGEAFTAKMRSGQPWITDGPPHPQAPGTYAGVTRMRTPESQGVRRGATPCPACGSFVCYGDVDPRACDQRAAERAEEGRRGSER